jgi:DNA-directed RNA polymerase specialized sigma24 family protein
MAHDIAQETWIVLRTNYAHIEDDTELVKIAFGISRNLCSRIKAKASRELPPAEEWNPESYGPSADDQVFRTQLEEAIQSLPGRCAELLLRELEGYTADEIKGMMGASRTGTVHVWTHRCIAALRKKLGIRGRK